MLKNYNQNITNKGNDDESLAHASVLTTEFAENNDQSGNMFNVVTLGNALTVTGLDLNLGQEGIQTIDVYETTGSWVGAASTPSDWKLVASGSVDSTGINTPTLLNTDFTLAADSTTGLYITTLGTDSMYYTDGTAVGAVAASNANLEILQGAGVEYSFGEIFTPRIWNGSIIYNVDPSTTVPEPASLSLVGLALLAMAVVRRKLQR